MRLLVEPASLLSMTPVAHASSVLNGAPAPPSIVPKEGPHAETFRLLDAIEQRLPRVISGKAATIRQYRGHHGWLVDEAAIGRTGARDSVNSGLPVPERSPFGSLLDRQSRRSPGSDMCVERSVRIAARAEAVFLGTSIRAFYLSNPTPLTVKAARPAWTAADADGRLAVVERAFQREVIARRYAKRFLDIPTLLDHETSGVPAYLVEHVVWGKRPSSESGDAVCDRLVPQLISLYEDYGYRFRRPAELVGAETAVTECDAALAFLDTDPARRRKLIEAIRKLLETPRGIAVSFSHGDLGLHNLLVDEAETVNVLGWGRAGEGVVARDVAALLEAAPRSFQNVAHAFMRSQNAFAPSNGVCSLPEQLATVGVMELARWRVHQKQGRRARAGQELPRRLAHYRDLVERHLTSDVAG